MSSGIKLDLGKTRYELLPPELLEGIAQILTFGAKKYADRNWEKGIDYSRVYGATMRHLWAWWGGEDNDKETGKSHLWHAGCELAFLIAFETRGMTHLDDRYKRVIDVDETGDDVLHLGAPIPAAELAPGEDVQPVSGGNVGLLAQRSEVRSVDRVQVASQNSEGGSHHAGLVAEATALGKLAALGRP